jgi:ribosomal-protein-alanine N-acetyltransferase
MLWWPNEVPVLQHGSVTLRPLEDTDIDAVYRACQDPLIPQFTRVISPYSHEDAADFVRSSPFAFTERRAIQFAIDSGVGDEREFAGAISIHSIKLADHAGELGYWMAPEFRGKNICSMAAELITEFALDSIGFNRIEALVDLSLIHI